jgi:UDP-3-O-[3-hydroxymyristoyl] glucosamine N-acyltransferase
MTDPRFYLTGPALSAEEAAAIAGADLRRSGSVRIARAAGLGEADLSGAVVFLETAAAAASVGPRAPALVIAAPAVADKLDGVFALAVMAKPKLGFARVASRLHQDRPFTKGTGVCASAKIGAGADIHQTATVGDGAEIGAGAAIGPGAVIGPGVVLAKEARIGANVVISHALIGARTAILSGAVIGEAGFGFVPGPEGLIRVPQLGRVVIGADVEIGANATVDRGALGDTVIGDGVKIDNLVQIAHNVMIGPNTVIAALAGVSGSVRIGAGVLMGGQVGIADHVEIGDRVEIAAQAGIMRDIPAGERWAGTPAKSARQWFREITFLANMAAKKKTGAP